MKKQSMKRLVLNRETVAHMQLRKVFGATGNSDPSCHDISSCAQNCSDVSVCWADQTKPLCN
jgi:hypothetical protein